MGREIHDHIYVKHDCLFKSCREKINKIIVSDEGEWGEQHVNPDDIKVEWDGRFFYVSGVEKYGQVYLDLYGEGNMDDLNGYYLLNTSENYDRKGELHW